MSLGEGILWALNLKPPSNRPFLPKSFTLKDKNLVPDRDLLPLKYLPVQDPVLEHVATFYQTRKRPKNKEKIKPLEEEDIFLDAGTDYAPIQSTVAQPMYIEEPEQDYSFIHVFDSHEVESIEKMPHLEPMEPLDALENVDSERPFKKKK